MRSTPLLLLLALAAPPSAATAQTNGAPAGVGEPRGEGAERERQADGLLSIIDVPAGPERWRALGPGVVPKLVAVARDPRALPSRRAGALEGLAAIGGPDARTATLDLAADEAAPWSVRASALLGAGWLLPQAELLAALRPVLERGGTPVVRAYAGRVLAERAGASGCALLRAQADRERGADRPYFDGAVGRCP